MHKQPLRRFRAGQGEKQQLFLPRHVFEDALQRLRYPHGQDMADHSFPPFR